MKVTAIIERGIDGLYAIYTKETTGKAGIHGFGSTPEEAKNDFRVAYEEIKEIMPNDVPEIEVTFKYDVVSFLRDVINLPVLHDVTGISKKRLQLYATGERKLTSSTVKRIEQGVHILADKLKEIQLA